MLRNVKGLVRWRRLVYIGCMGGKPPNHTHPHQTMAYKILRVQLRELWVAQTELIIRGKYEEADELRRVIKILEREELGENNGLLEVK